MPNKPSEVSVKVIYRGGYVWYNLTAAEFAEKFGKATMEDVQKRVAAYKDWKKQEEPTFIYDPDTKGSKDFLKDYYASIVSSPATSLPSRNWNDADGFSDSNGI